MLSEDEASAIIAKLPRDSNEQKMLTELLRNSIRNKSPPKLTTEECQLDAQGSSLKKDAQGSDDDVSSEEDDSEKDGSQDEDEDGAQGIDGEPLQDHDSPEDEKDGSQDVVVDKEHGHPSSIEGDDDDDEAEFDITETFAAPEREVALQDVGEKVIFDTIEKLKEEDETRNADQIIHSLQEQHGVTFSAASLYRIKVYLQWRSNRDR
jgi:hypothetical protein